jgi:DinB superfamily
MAVYNKAEIISELDKNVTAFNHYISILNKEQFESTPEGKWSAGQHLEHLNRSIKPLTTAYALPGFFLKMMFGKTNRSSRTFDGLVEKYKSKLLGGGKASGRFVPPVVLFDQKNKMIGEYKRREEELIKKINRWREEELDFYILPHPLLGKLTLREMLFFTIYHNEHHFETLRKRT